MSAFHSRESAAVADAQSTVAAPQEVLTFRLGSEEYGIDILRVQEIRGFEQPTRIAGSSAHVLGVLNLRGVIVPVVDLRMRFGLPTDVDSTTVTVVLNLAGRTVGAVVDAVSDVTALASEQIRPAPAMSGSVDATYITALACLGQGESQRMLILLDIAKLMAGELPAGLH